MSVADAPAREPDDGPDKAPPLLASPGRVTAAATMALAQVKAQASTHAGRAVVARILGLPISAVLAFATSRIIIDQYGFESYGLFALVLAIPALLPSKDLGLGAKVIDVVARRASLGAEEVEATLGAAVTRVTRIALVGIVGVFVIQSSVGWHELLGGDSRRFPSVAISVALALFILSLPGALSEIGRAHV